MASPKTVIIACSAVFLLAAGLILATQFAPASDPVAHLDGRFLPDSGDVKLQAWAAQPAAAPRPASRPVQLNASITDTAQQRLILEYNELSKIPDVAPGPLVTLEPGQPLETDSGTFRLIAFAVYDATHRPMRFRYAVNAKGETMTEAELRKLGGAANAGWSSYDSYLRAELLFEKARNIRPAHVRMLTGTDLRTATASAGWTHVDTGNLVRVFVPLPFAPTARPALALDLYAKPQSIGKLTLSEKSSLNCGSFGELFVLTHKAWTPGNSTRVNQANDHVKWSYAGRPNGTFAVLRIPDGVARARFTFNHLTTQTAYDTRDINHTMMGLSGSKNDSEAEVLIHQSAQRVIQKLPPVKYPEFTAAADPLDWPLPATLTTPDQRATHVIYRMTGFWVDLGSVSGWEHDESMAAYADCRTTRDILRKISAKLTAQRLEFRLNRQQNFISAEQPPPTIFERFLKFLRTFF